MVLAERTKPTVTAGQRAAGATPAPVGFATAAGFGLLNGKIVTSIASNALTIAIKTLAGTDPTPLDPVYASFRSSDLAGGGYDILEITTECFLTLLEGSTLSGSGVSPFRIWLVLFNDSSITRIGAGICTSITTVGAQTFHNTKLALTEHGVASSTAEGGGAATLDGTIYTSVAVTSKPRRILGYLDYYAALSVGGRWDALPNVTQLFGPGVKKPGEIVQISPTIINNVDATVDVIPFDTTLPQSSEGELLKSHSVTPVSRLNILRVECLMTVSAAAAVHAILALFMDSEASARGAMAAYIAGATQQVTILLHALVRAGTESEIAFKLRSGSSSGAVSVTFGTNNFGGACLQVLTVTEIMV